MYSYNTKNVICYFTLIIKNLTKTNDQSTQILSGWHVSDHSIHHQVYTDLKFIGKCQYIELPSQYLWDTTSLQKKFLLLALQSSSTTVLCCSRSCDSRLQFLILANHCSCWVVFIVSIWFPASEGYQDTYFLWGQVVSLMPNPQPGGPGYPI